MKNVEMIEKILVQNEGWNEEYIGLFSHENYNMTIDTNSGGLEFRDLDGNGIAYMGEDESESSLIEFSKFVQGFLNSTTYRADCPF